HPVAIDAQTIDKSVYAGGSFVIQRIQELTGRYPPVRELYILNRELAAQFRARLVDWIIA
ncbi:MAG: hypothetical protein WBF14_13085, partial [Candidatus Acidiferrales bacterium]